MSAGLLIIGILATSRWHPLAWQPKAPDAPPGPLSIRTRTTKLVDVTTGLPRKPPAQADISLDYFQRTFPDVTTQEHLLILRWEDLASVFGGSDAANELVLKEPSILRWPRPMPRRAFHYLSTWLGPQVARHVVWECPFVLTKRAGTMRKSLPALLNVFGTKERLAEIATEYPSLMHIPVSDFYHGMASMIAVCGNPEKALEVSKEAMDRIRENPRRAQVPQIYPTLVAIFGGMEEAHAAIDEEPLLLKWKGDMLLGKLYVLREYFGREGAQQIVRKEPHLLLHEGQKKSRKWRIAYSALQNVFGEDARDLVLERPELLTLGASLQRALRFAERKLGSVEEVRNNFESVLRRTGLAEWLKWETAPRPRHGYWTPKTRLPNGYPPQSNSWSPLGNPLGTYGVPRGRWDELEEEPAEEEVEEEVVDVEDVREERELLTS